MHEFYAATLNFYSSQDLPAPSQQQAPGMLELPSPLLGTCRTADAETHSVADTAPAQLPWKRASSSSSQPCLVVSCATSVFPVS